MFIGSANKKVCQQIVTSIDFNDWKNVYIGCSGSFRIEFCLAQKFPGIQLHSSDISLISCAVGYAATGQTMPVDFHTELEFLRPYVTSNPKTVLAATGVALSYLKQSVKNEYGRTRRASILQNAEELFLANIEKNERLFDGLIIKSFYPGDFTHQIQHAYENGGGFTSFAPTYKGGYENIYKALDENTAWARPTYEVWDPKNTHTLIDQCKELGIPYCILYDQLLEGYQPTSVYYGSGHPVYTYSGGKSSVRRDTKRVVPFSYKPVIPANITQESKAEVYPISAENINFLKTIYLSKGIKFVNGMANFIVTVDDMLVGGFTYSLPQFGDKLTNVYLLSDFAINGQRRLAKLIALMATSSTITHTLDTRWMTHIQTVHTTAFTTKPISMKYRGIFEISKRTPTFINYHSSVRNMTPQEIFAYWWEKHGSKS